MEGRIFASMKAAGVSKLDVYSFHQTRKVDAMRRPSWPIHHLDCVINNFARKSLTRLRCFPAAHRRTQLQAKRGCCRRMRMAKGNATSPPHRANSLPPTILLLPPVGPG
jgi:hypothetical protein